MKNSVVVSASIPIELSIMIEAHLEQKKMKRSELVKSALEQYFDHNKQPDDRKIMEMLLSINNEVKEIKNKLK